MSNHNKYLYMYLAISFGACWGIGLAYMLFGDILVPITGPLTLLHPLTIIALYSPSIAGLIAYYAMGGSKAVKGVFSKLIPRKQDLFWFPVLLGVVVLFVLTMHYGSKLFGIPLPQMTYSIPEMFLIGLWNLIEETGLIGGIFGWIGFLLPFLQGKFKNNVTSSLLTGLIFGLWVMPGYVISSYETSTSYFLYVIQLMFFIWFQSYVFNATRGTLLFYLFTFWLTATGSRLQFYYFNAQVQILQVSFFLIAAIIMHFIYNKQKEKNNYELQMSPQFIQA
ncbi:hypothetical protein [Paenibacillus alvei]|uniref:CPBP family intramembrane metalloprotease n=1 Tax=Paenibacillus alvei TaxID=44250 RepID=A0A383R8Z9_PAEAL|nr:hypothetical protein [Paenibacillus alvei]SYX83430.1 conserved membrane protein of unknown function [Paenibacillus alvei]